MSRLRSREVWRRLARPLSVLWIASALVLLVSPPARAQWGGWERFDGTILEQPSCVSWAATRLDCFARGENRAMLHRWFDGSQWGGWEDLGGVILEQPSCVSWGPNRLDCFARGLDRAMLHRWFPMIDFEELSPDTVISAQYQRLGVVFGPPGFLPHAVKVVPGEANSGTTVASISCGPNCGVRFPVPFTTGTFIGSTRSHVEVFVGEFAGQFAEPAEITLIARNSFQQPVGQPARAAVMPGAGFHTRLAVDSPLSDIASFEVTARTGVDSGKQIGIDDLAFDNPTILTPDFSIAATSGITVPQGTTATLPIAINRLNGSTGDVQFAATGVPAGVQATFTPNPADASGTTLVLTAAADAPPLRTPLPVTVQANPLSPSAGKTQHSLQFALAVPANFVVSIDPHPVAVSPCLVAKVPISVTRDFAFTGTLSLSAEGLPAGITASFDPPSLGFASGGRIDKSVLTLVAPKNNPAGTANVAIVATSGGLPLSRATLTLLSLSVSPGACGPILEVSDLSGTFTNPPFSHPANNTWLHDLFNGQTYLKSATPIWEWTPLLDQHNEFDSKTVGVSGTALKSGPSFISGNDVPFTHPFGFDFEFMIAPDPQYLTLLGPTNGGIDPVTGQKDADGGEYFDATTTANRPDGLNLHLPGVLGVETDQDLVPPHYRVQEFDRVAVFGRWIVDTGHKDYHTEIHPPLLLVCARSGSAEETHSTVVGRPYLVSQEFGDGALYQHLIKELLKIPTGIPGIPGNTQVEAHPKIFNTPFSGIQVMTYAVRPPSPRKDPSDKLRVRYHFTARSGVALQLTDNAFDDTVQVTILMNDAVYTPAPLPTKHELSFQISQLDSDLGTHITDGLVVAAFGSPLVGFPDPLLAPLLQLVLGRGILTDSYDAPRAASVHDTEVTEVAANDLGGGPHFSVDDGQPFPVYGFLDVTWERGAP